ncbi:hypothetical protein CRENBAI_023582 [Crenichthys baileyi]|uniref:Uncharacterized protein n=1 Tax=Crenichthys baileyi TaxID=28760 RepID=A0AAV9QX77_9TELE
MDFFDDPSLYVGGLEGLDEDGFHSTPSLVDELNLSAGFEPLQVEALGPGKHQEMMPPVSSQQAVPSYNQPLVDYTGVKAQNHLGQVFSSSQSTGCDLGREQHGQYHNATISQVPQPNGLFCSTGSPMWGNQGQNGNVFHHVSQQQQHCHQQLHNQQLHGRQHTQQQHHSGHLQSGQQQERMRQLQQQQSHQQQLLNQHQQITTASVCLQQQQHHAFSFHQGGQSGSQQQMHHSQHQLPVRESQFHSRTPQSKPYLERQNVSLSGTCLQTRQQQGSYQLLRGGQAFAGSGLEDSPLSFPIHSSSAVHSLPTCSISSAHAYPAAEFPAYPGEPEIPSLSQQSSCRPITTAPITTTVPRLPGTACQFQSTAHVSQLHSGATVNQADECPFRALCCSGETQAVCKSSEMFGESVSCYPSMTNHLSSEPHTGCGVINTNGYQTFGDNVLTSVAQDGDLEGLDPPDLLPDLLPQLEDAFRQQDESSCSWVDFSQKNGHENKKPTAIECKDEKVERVPLCLETCNQWCSGGRWILGGSYSNLKAFNMIMVSLARPVYLPCAPTAGQA